MARSAPGRRAPPTIPAPLLAARLEREPPPPIVVLAGAERFFRAWGLEGLLAVALPQGDPGGGLVRLDGRSGEDGQRVALALDELASVSLFGGPKVVVVENAEAATLHALTGAALITHLVQEARRLAPLGGRLIVSTALPVKGRGCVAMRALTDAGAWVVDCRALYDAPAPWERGATPHDHELARFLVARLRRDRGKRMRLQDAHALSRLVGSDLGRLDDALRSLALFVGERDSVDAQDIEQAVGVTREDPVWRLADAVLDGDAPTALDLVTAAFERGLSDGRGGLVTRPEALSAVIGAALHRSFKRVLAGAEALAAGQAPDAVAKAQGVAPFLAGRYLERCRRDPARLLHLHGAFLEAEQGVKGGGVPPRLATERLVVLLVTGLAGTGGVPARP